jgi:chromosome segregation ATPase
MSAERNRLQAELDAVDAAPTDEAVEKARSEMSDPVSSIEEVLEIVTEQRNHLQRVSGELADEDGQRTHAELRKLRDAAVAALENERRVHEATRTLLVQAQAASDEVERAELQGQVTELQGQATELQGQVHTLRRELDDEIKLTQDTLLNHTDEVSKVDPTVARPFVP